MRVAQLGRGGGLKIRRLRVQISPRTSHIKFIKGRMQSVEQLDFQSNPSEFKSRRPSQINFRLPILDFGFDEYQDFNPKSKIKYVDSSLNG